MYAMSLDDFFYTHDLNCIIYVLMTPESSKLCIKALFSNIPLPTVGPQPDCTTDSSKCSSSKKLINFSFVFPHLREYPSLPSCPSYRYGSSPRLFSFTHLHAYSYQVLLSLFSPSNLSNSSFIPHTLPLYRHLIISDVDLVSNIFLSCFYLYPFPPLTPENLFS